MRFEITLEPGNWKKCCWKRYRWRQSCEYRPKFLIDSFTFLNWHRFQQIVLQKANIQTHQLLLWQFFPIRFQIPPCSSALLYKWSFLVLKDQDIYECNSLKILPNKGLQINDFTVAPCILFQLFLPLFYVSLSNLVWFCKTGLNLNTYYQQHHTDSPPSSFKDCCL